MKKVEVVGSAQTIHGGLVKLSKDQAAVRAHCLKKTKTAGVFEIVKPVHFKIGESFEFEEIKSRPEDKSTGKKE